MAKKNTLSILETIKSKITKFDEKTDKAVRASELDDEFEYVTSETKSTNNQDDDGFGLGLDKPSEQDPLAVDDLPNIEEKEDIVPKFEDDLGIGDLDEEPDKGIPVKVNSDHLSDDELFNSEEDQVEKSFDNIPTGSGNEENNISQNDLSLSSLDQTQDSNDDANSDDDPLDILKGSRNELFKNNQSNEEKLAENTIKNPLPPAPEADNFNETEDISKTSDSLDSSNSLNLEQTPVEDEKLTAAESSVTENSPENALEDFSFDDEANNQETNNPQIAEENIPSVSADIAIQNEVDENIAENSIPVSNSTPAAESDLEPFNMNDFADVATAKAEESKEVLEDDLNSNIELTTEENQNPSGVTDSDSLDHNQNDEPQNIEQGEKQVEQIEKPNLINDDNLSNELPAQDPFGNPIDEEDVLTELSETNDGLSLDDPKQANEENLDNNKSNADVIFSKKEVEGYEGEIDFDENAKVKSITDTEVEDDIDLDMIGVEENLDEDDELTLDDDFDLELIDDEIETEQKSEDILSDDDFSLDDDLDSLDQQEENREEEVKEEKQDLSAESLDDELDLDELDKELEAKEKELQKEKPVSKEIEDDLNQDVDDILGESKADEEPKTEAKQEKTKDSDEDLDDLNFDDLEDDLEEVKTDKRPETKLDKVDNFDLEELEQEAKKAEEKLDKIEEVTKRAIDAKLPEVSVENKIEFENQNKEEKKTSKDLSDIDEIDLEFEKEMMGLKPGEHKKKGDEKKEEFKEKEVLKENSIEKEFEPKKEEKVEFKKEEKPVTDSLAEEIELQREDFDDDEDDLFTDDISSNHEDKPDLTKELSIAESDIDSDLKDSQIQVIQNKSSMLSDETVSQAQDSIKRLVDAKKVVSGISTFSKSPALAELAVEIMEPKLERWINEHLPEVVENIVREEIKKIIPKD